MSNLSKQLILKVEASCHIILKKKKSTEKKINMLLLYYLCVLNIVTHKINFTFFVICGSFDGNTHRHLKLWLK